MRLVIVGTSAAGLATARLLIEHKHDVVVIERDKSRIDELAEELDCGFLQGDGARPKLLREAGPEDTDALLCLTNDDQDNIIASLVARSLGYRRVVTKIEDPELQHICAELGLAGSLVPMQTVGRYLADMAEGQDIIELSDILRGDTRVFSFRANAAEAVRIDQLDLPDAARTICIYRNGQELLFADPSTKIQVGDEVVLLTRARMLKPLRERFGYRS